MTPEQDKEYRRQRQSRIDGLMTEARAKCDACELGGRIDWSTGYHVPPFDGHRCNALAIRKRVKKLSI